MNAHASVSAPSTEGLRDLAAWSVRLAKIDGIYRRHEVDATFEEASPDLVGELVDLLAVVPFDRLIHPDQMHLNPTFGQASALVGSADADLIAGDLLLDFKTTKFSEVRGEHMNQLFGYFLLNRRAGFPVPGGQAGRHLLLPVRQNPVRGDHCMDGEGGFRGDRALVLQASRGSVWQQVRG